MGGKKRDRWDSSSDEEEDKKKESSSIAKKKNGSAKKEETSSSVNELLACHNPLLQGCRSVYDTYERISHVSEGTYGIVWKARDLATNEIVALKQIKFHVNEDQPLSEMSSNRHNSNGFPVTALREISVLLALSHESIVSVREMVVGDAIDKVFMVMEFFDCDLSDAMSKNQEALPQSELKGIMKQILEGADHMHSHWYLHRDLKPSNILVHRQMGRIALADLGLARRYQEPLAAMTLLVVTLWYRCPELLFGEQRYGPPVDMWSIGCIFGELILGGGQEAAILPGQGELDQIDRIFSLVGIPNATTWPTFESLPNAGLFRWKNTSEEDILLPRKFPVAKTVGANNRQAFLDSNGYDLLKGLLTLDPSKRLTAQQALAHPFFSSGVMPKRPQFE